MKKLNWLLWLMPISGLAIIVLGIILFFVPPYNFSALAVVFGAAILASGILELISYFGDARENRSGTVLAGGILSILFGTWTIFGSRLDESAIILPFMLAAWIMSIGVSRMVEAVNRKSQGGKLKMGLLIFGVLGTFVGFALLFHPVMPPALVSQLLAFIMVSHGVGTITLFFRLKKQGKILAESPEPADWTEDNRDS